MYLNKGNGEGALQEFVKVLENKQDTKAAGLYREKAKQMLEKINTGSRITGRFKSASGVYSSIYTSLSRVWPTAIEDKSISDVDR